jgi:hypothetical protein
MTYAQKIIDALVDELTERGPTQGDLRWRSRVLNPILQRQLHGYMDHEPQMLATEFGDLEGEALKKAVNTFYLSRDPLHPSEQFSFREGVLYVTQARWGLAVSSDVTKLWDSSHYKLCMKNTCSLLRHLGEGGKDITDVEAAVIMEEGIVDHFVQLYEEVSLRSGAFLTLPA